MQLLNIYRIYGMTDLNAATFFGGGEEADPDDLGKVEVDNFTTAVDRALHDNFGWDGSAVGAVGLTLSADNSQVLGGVFITRGKTGLSECRLPCDQVWPGAPHNITLAIDISTLDPFTFGSGGLWSDIVSSSKFRHAFYDKSAGASNAPILGTPAGKGIGEFSLRIVCQPSSTSSARKGVVCKYIVVLFPESAEQLSDTPESKFAGWPGLKIGEGYFPIKPRPSKEWKCPILPVIRPGAAFAEAGTAPSGERLRHAIAAIMRKVAQPDLPRSGGSILSKWQRIRTNPRELAEKGPATCWPRIAELQEEEGK